MEFVCEQCDKHFVSKYNLKRHMERKHDSWHAPSNEDSSESVNGNENKRGESSSDSENNTSSEDSDHSDDTESENSDSEGNSESEDSDTYSHAEVRAILRYTLQANE